MPHESTDTVTADAVTTDDHDARITAAVLDAMRKHPVTGRRLAKEIDVPYHVLWRRLQGQTPFRASEVVRIARFLRVPVTRLITPR